MLQSHTKNIMHGGLTPSKFICNCNGVFKRKSDFGSKSTRLLRCKISNHQYHQVHISHLFSCADPSYHVCTHILV